MTGIDPPVVSVTQVNRVVGMLIKGDRRLANVAVRGEISNFTRHYKTGHLYFTLKDEQTQLKAVMFAGNAARLRFDPDNGDKVVCYGAITVYEPNGVYQINCSAMEPDGAGEQAKALEELKKRLAAQGLFDQKRPLPRLPKCVAVVTSAGGAALQDVINIISRRCPVVRLIVIPAKVQGEGADISVAAAIARAQDTDADVIIFGRGGGSAEDLSAFNSEVVARAVFASRIPTISAVGHETDFSIADLTADMRAPTPSAAAELAVPELGNIHAAIEGTMEQIRAGMLRRLSDAERSLEAQMSLIAALSPKSRLNNAEQRLDELSAAIRTGMHHRLDRAEQSLKANAEIISALDPLGVLARGFSLTSTDRGIVTSAAQLSPGDSINVRLSEGSVRATVTEIL
ncbi:MAG: exodeoxyribonuclease VII large subunit [Oscillospiraceae bacterium]|nr:exodeoxyribonuclease VII large subunit [Oscillospiraceae bacterium]